MSLFTFFQISRVKKNSSPSRFSVAAGGTLMSDHVNLKSNISSLLWSEDLSVLSFKHQKSLPLLSGGVKTMTSAGPSQIHLTSSGMNTLRIHENLS